MAAVCPVRHPKRDYQKPMVLCSPMQCSDTATVCENTKPAFSMKQFDMNDTEVGPKFPNVLEKTGQLWDDYKIETILSAEQKDSKSDSVIAFATHKKTGTEVVIKAFTKTTKTTEDNQGNQTIKTIDTFSDNLPYEMCVYRNMKALSMNIPHFVSYISEYVYEDHFFSSVQESRKLAEFNNYRLIRQELFKLSYLKYHLKYPEAFEQILRGCKLNFLITHLVDGPTLFEYFNYETDTLAIASVLFQLVFILYAMYQSGIQHNDLHANNILIDTEPESAKILYQIEGLVFVVPTPVKVYVFDFDQSTAGFCGPNPKLTPEGYLSPPRADGTSVAYNMCSNNGICNYRNAKNDIYTIFSMIPPYSSLQSAIFQDFLSAAIGHMKPESKVKNRLNGSIYASIYATDDKPDWIKSPQELLTHQLFKNWLWPTSQA